LLEIEKDAPDFKAQALVNGETKDIKLSDYRGKWVVLFFYPLDFTPVCTSEVPAFSQRIDEFEAKNAVVLAASVDSAYSHRAWVEQIGPISYPIISDITKSISRAYGVLLEEKGIATRGSFIIDPDGKLMYILVHPTTIGRSIDETLRVLQALQTGEACPINWRPGTATLSKKKKK